MRCAAQLCLLLWTGDARLRERLLGRYPGARLTGEAACVPLGEVAAEEILADCCAAGIPVLASAVRSLRFAG